MSRLNFAPKPSEIEITDIKNGVGSFTPKPDKIVSFAALKESLGKAGYTLASAKITVSGKFAREGDRWFLTAEASTQRFALLGEAWPGAAPDKKGEVTGDWKTSAEGKEVITPLARKRSERKTDDEERNRANVAYVDVTSGEAISSSPLSAAPIRTTSPGLTVYRGGAFVPRYIYTRQELGGLKVDRQILLLDFSYTPTPRRRAACGK